MSKQALRIGGIMNPVELQQLSAVQTSAPMSRRIDAMQGARNEYVFSRERGESEEQATLAARSRAARTLQVLDGARDIASIAIAGAVVGAGIALAMPDPKSRRARGKRGA